MIEINIKRYENGEKTSVANKDVEVSELYNFMYYEMKDFLKKSKEISYKETHYDLRCGKSNLLITFEQSDFRTRKWRFIFNGISYSYRKRLQGLKDAVPVFLHYVEKDAKLKRT